MVLAACDAASLWLSDGVEACMNRFNKRADTGESGSDGDTTDNS
jgi:hypothetical protein